MRKLKTRAGKNALKKESWDSSMMGGEEIMNFEEFTTYQALRYLSEKVKNSELNKTFWEDRGVQACLEVARKDLPMNDNQIVIFSLIGACSLFARSVSLDSLGSMINVNPYVLFELDRDMQKLVEAGYLEIHVDDWESLAYGVNRNLLVSLLNGKKIKIIQKKAIENNLDFLNYIEKLFREPSILGDKYIKLKQSLETYGNLDFVKRMVAYEFSDMECLLIMYLLLTVRKDGWNVPISMFLDKIEEMGDSEDLYDFHNYIYNKSSRLFRMKFMEILPSDFNQGDYLNITKRALECLLPKEKTIFCSHDVSESSLGVCNVLKPAQIKKKTLVYDVKTEEQVETLREILSRNGLKTLQRNLKKKGLRKGINVLLYGYAGMGKTETVLQLCKECGRQILQVSISDMKSHWFGKSERIVAGLFKEYGNLMKKNRTTPVLLFNEADGVLSKRKEIRNDNGVAQTENAIQNVLLQAFEDNEGIIVCTTNMIENLDTAFSRRFLYKIEFSKPDLATKVALLKLKLGEYITDDECSKLASNYQLTGGILDNVLTKIVAKQCLYNLTPDFAEIEEFCRLDSLGKSERRPVGF